MDDRGAKITLEYPIPEEEDAARFAMNGLAWALVAWDMDQYLRGLLKYSDMDEVVEDALEEARDKLFDIIAEHGVSLEDIP